MLKKARKHKQQKPHYALRIISLLRKRSLNHVLQLSAQQLCQFQQGLKILIEKSSSSSRNFQIYKLMLHHVHQNLQASKNPIVRQNQQSDLESEFNRCKSVQYKTSDSFSNVQRQIQVAQLDNTFRMHNRNQISQNQIKNKGNQYQIDGFKQLKIIFRPIQMLFKTQVRQNQQAQSSKHIKIDSPNYQKQGEQKRQILFSYQQQLKYDSNAQKSDTDKNIDRLKLKMQ